VLLFADSVAGVAVVLRVGGVAAAVSTVVVAASYVAASPVVVGVAASSAAASPVVAVVAADGIAAVAGPCLASVAYACATGQFPAVAFRLRRSVASVSSDCVVLVVVALVVGIVHLCR
jgi:hypothetical protein